MDMPFHSSNERRSQNDPNHILENQNSTTGRGSDSKRMQTFTPCMKLNDESIIVAFFQITTTCIKYMYSPMCVCV